MPHILINLRAFPFSKVCAFHRYGVRHAPFWCAPYAVFLCGLFRFMQKRLLVEGPLVNGAISPTLVNYRFGVI
jgi:hypothetical protein